MVVFLHRVGGVGVFNLCFADPLTPPDPALPSQLRETECEVGERTSEGVIWIVGGSPGPYGYHSQAGGNVGVGEVEG